jgi:hypothetical protein
VNLKSVKKMQSVDLQVVDYGSAEGGRMIEEKLEVMQREEDRTARISASGF